MTMTNEEADVAKPSAIADAASGATSRAPSSAKKRLLPMELRRRRRAAKLQITSERDVATISARDIIESLNEKDSMPDSAAERDLRLDSEPVQARAEMTALEVSPLDQQPNPIEEKEVPAKQTATDQSTEPKSSQLPTAARPTTTKQLQNLFSFSLLDRKRQKLQHREFLVDVPTLMKVDQVPIDLAPKSKAVITMPFLFPFTRPRAASMAEAMERGASGKPEVRWIQALQYYVHPASSLPPSLSAVNEKHFDESDFYVQRFRMWQDSFRHAYFGFRRLPENGALYVRYPEFMACFYIDSKSKRDQPSSILELCRAHVATHEQADDSSVAHKPQRRLCAVISQSNARLRKELHRRGVDFHVPFNLRAMQKPVSSTHLHDDDELVRHPVATAGPEQSVHGPDSLLRFCGHESVHGLYEFLLNRKPHSNQDVPEILAHHPFANAAIRSVAVRYMGKTAAHSTLGHEEDGLGATHAPEIRSEIELSGFCSTATIVKLMRCLEDSQKEDASVRVVSSDLSMKAALETAPLCERLNAIFLDDKHANGVGQTARQRELWKQQLDFAKRRLQTIKTLEGTTATQIEMATR